MARIRSIKPEFWTAEQVMELTRDARLLFVGLWNFCDDAGIHPAKVKTLKAEVFPSEDLTSADVRRMIDECIEQGLVLEYQSQGETYWQVTGWHHQKIDRPSFKYPKPCGEVPEGAAKRKQENSKESKDRAENSTNDQRALDECSTNDQRALDERSPPEGRGEESTGVNPSTVIERGVNSTVDAQTTVAAPTRKGLICGLLRKAGMADAAPHYLPDDEWDAIFAKRSDEEIVELAKAKMASKPNERIGLKYIRKALLEDPAPISINGQAQPRMTQHQRNQAAIAESLFGPQSRGPIQAPAEKLIEGEVIHERA